MGSTKIRFSGDTGFNAGLGIRDENDLIWDGTELVEKTLPVLDYADDTPISEEDDDEGYYSLDIAEDIPTLPAGKYHVTAYDLDQETNNVLYQVNIEWDGTQLVDDLVTGTSIADICNMALSHLGVGKQIANLETDDTEEASALRTFYTPVLEATLRDGYWPFAERTVALALVEEDPNSLWGYSYRSPSNMLRFGRIVNGLRVDDRSSRVPSKMGGDDSGGLIFTDQEDAEAEYLAKVTNPLRFPPDFVLAFSFGLAFYISPRLSGVSVKLRTEAYELWRQQLMNSKANAGNENRPDADPDPEMISVRD